MTKNRSIGLDIAQPVIHDASIWYAPLDDRFVATDEDLPEGVHSDRFLALLARGEPGPRDRVCELATSAIAYQAVPIVPFSGDRKLATRVAGIPGVAAVVHAPVGSVDSETLVEGFDRLIGLALTQQYSTSGTFEVVGGEEAAAEPTSPALMPVINFSVGPKSTRYPLRPDDPVNLATLAASGQQLVVAAAGNAGAGQEETMSAWAQPDWVLSVGGSVDADGTELAEKSSRGVAGNPESGPDVIAHGVSDLNAAEKGTSFAAPRVAFLAIAATAALLQLRRCWLEATGQTVRGIQLVGTGFVDCDFPSGARIRQAPGLPVVGIDQTAAADAIEIAQRAGTALHVQGRPQLLRSMILASARPMPGYGPHEVGAGFVDASGFEAWLAARTGLDLVEWFATDGSELDDGAKEELLALRLFDPSTIPELFRAVLGTRPTWMYDYATRELTRIP